MKRILIATLFCIYILNAKAGVSIVNGLSHVHEVGIGEICKGIIEIKNTGSKAERLKVFVNDFRYNAKGQTFYEEPSTHNRSNADWLKLGTTNIEIQPGQIYLLPYRMQVPDSLALKGSFWSVIIIEPAEDFDLQDQNNAIGITTRMRYAIQIIADIGNDLQANVKFQNAEINYTEGRKLLMIDLEDTGELYHKVVVSSEFFETTSGNTAGVYYSPKQSIHPNNSKRFIIDVSELEDGDYLATLLANCEDESFFGVNVSIRIDSSKPNENE
ncbi:MAG: hypothetical protein ACERIH_11470 [Labilibaculum antarcticum]